MTAVPTTPLHFRRVGFDPHPELTGIRDRDGVRRVDSPVLGGSMWLVTRIEDVRLVYSDPKRFRISAHHLVPGAPALSDEEVAAVRPGNLLAFDPPEHTRLRRVLAPEFTARRMRRLEPRIHDIVRDHLDAIERKGPPADLVADFALPVPALVICELLGVPFADREAFQDRYSRFFDVTLSFEERLAIQYESKAYLAELVARARVEPGDDLLGMLVRDETADLDDRELVGIADLLLLAGHETTANMLGLGVLALLSHPDQLRLLRDEPERADAVVEELLRWLTVVHTGVPRVTTTEVELGGQTLGPGELVVCSLPAANRDPGLVPDPDRFDVTRDAGSHVAFGHGVHHCLGAPLARMEMRIAFPALARRFPALRTTDEDARYRTEQVVYGVGSLPVTW
ncbi:cytochrome P450 [Saccharothrix sp. NRRL B-16348]|uniref:cytochrome P450 n=1 Tax=Saccharothrix sp. NRRL B-16348 TaxID=1415542 RepID=UPI0006AEA99B|nr:cytochrome P450 [Saccharothrix sp. NRRL B-16348]KOX13822.1 cytochrome P450 [Saccharothrix sp. NRRL B-16348]